MDNNQIVEVMIDLETTGMKPGCHILQIGACAFGPAATFLEKKFFIGSASATDERFLADRRTLGWWSTQPKHIKEEVFSSQDKIEMALNDFSNYLGAFPYFRVWGNAASFDLKILEAAYEICGIPLPWSYRSEMCYRTLKHLYPNIPYKKPARAHIALEDAIAQANHADEILRYKKAVEDQDAFRIMGIPLNS